MPPNPLETRSLPVFSKMPPKYPHFSKKEALDWWTVPFEAAQDAQFLFLLPDEQDPQRLLFVQPVSGWFAGKFMLGKQRNKYCLVYVQKRGGKIILQTSQGNRLMPEGIKPLGVVCKQICTLKITP